MSDADRTIADVCSMNADNILGMALLLTLLLPAAVHPAQPASRLLDEVGQTIVRRATVPRDRQPVAEVRLIRRKGAVVAETVVSTFLFQRVVDKIRRSEGANWPEQRPGHDDSRRYLHALEDFDQPTASPDTRARRRKRVQMAIEFIMTADAGWVALSRIELDDSKPTGTITKKDPVAILSVSRAYAERNIALIAADAFGLDEQQARMLLGPGPNIPPPSR